MLNLFKRPVETATFEAWSKMCDDVAKVSVMALPVVFYGPKTIYFKTFNILFLLGVIYLFLAGGRYFRNNLNKGDNNG